MDHNRVQCPVCTLYLHSGMSLESHLDTHPKDQVIKALCNISAKNASYANRIPTPMHSERSYRSRSRTPVNDDGVRWMGSHRSSDSDRYWRRTPSRNKSNASSNVSRNDTPEVRVGDMNIDSAPNSQYFETSYPMKSDKMQQTYDQTPTGSDIYQQSPCFTESSEDKEVKFSRSSEYSTIDNSSTLNANATPTPASGRLQMHVVPPVSRRGSNVVKILPKPNLVVKTNMAGVQYLSQGGVKPVHVIVPTTPTFVQKNVQSNMILSGSLPCTPMLDTKTVGQQLGSNHFNQLSSSNFTPSTTVVTQNSQLIYHEMEMVHTLDGKPFISNMPTVISGHNAVANVAQSSSVYQNVMVVDQFGNTSCVYPTTQQFISKPCNATIYSAASSQNFSSTVESKANASDANKTLIIEVSPIISKRRHIPIPIPLPDSQAENKNLSQKSDIEKVEPKYEAPGSSKGLKILSNIKVEVPVQHNKNMLNTIMDLTGSLDNEYADRSDTPEKILPDFDDQKSNDSAKSTVIHDNTLPTNTFSVIQNVPNVESPKSEVCDNKMDIEFSDSCPVPDLICNEKPSISPCSELSEQGDSNSTDQISLSPKPKILQSFQKKIENKVSPINKEVSVIERNIEKKSDNAVENDKKLPVRIPRNSNIRLNNLYVKKHKKVLQIKNAKSFSVASSSSTNVIEPKPSSSTCRSPDNYSIKKKPHIEKKDIRPTLMHTVSIDRLKDDSDYPPEFDANIEEQSMDIEPVAPSCIGHSEEYNSIPVVVEVKEELNSSNEGAFGGENDRSIRDLTPMEGLRPINVITYGNVVSGEFDEDSNHKELLDLEAASKNKPFVSIMNENYFADYFSAERGESFQSEKETDFRKETSKEGVFAWGESSQKEEGEFVLPNFIHESYKIAESSGGYSEMGGEEGQSEVDGEKCEQDSKADVLSESRSEGETPLNICADERMPPRGELSGQESNGDMESPWSGIYSEVTPSEPYDLIARESWVSDGSEVDASEKRENLEEELPYAKARTHACAACCARFTSSRELRAHRALAHAPPACSAATYSRLLSARAIKRELKPEATVLEETVIPVATNLLAMADSKDSMATTMLQVYDAMTEAKPQLMGLIKQETKRRRRDYVCPTCKVDQQTDVAFHTHLKIHPLECLTCGKCFFKRANLALHMKTHLGIKNYKCDVCEKRFVTRQKLSEHYNIHTGRAPFKCTLCDETFRRYSNMVQHRDRHHFQKKAKVRDFVCQCGAVFHSRAKLLWHKETHEERPKACLYCSDKFVHAASLTRHVRRTHNEYYLSEKLRGKVDNVPCPVCKQVYLRTNLRAHLQTHSGKRPYVCIVCNKSFTTKWNLKLHRWTHASRSAKPFKCSLCKGAFIRHTEYISHMNAHKSVRPYTCNYCGCQFIRKYNCQRHVREHEMAKKYVCKVPECGKSFHRSYYLSEHMKVHSGARPFSCNICGKTSSNKSNHNKHVKIHHAREPVATEA